MIVILVNNFVFGDYIDVDGAVYGIGLSSAVTVVLCLTFIPKVCMYVSYSRTSLYKDSHTICPGLPRTFQSSTISKSCPSPSLGNSIGLIFCT